VKELFTTFSQAILILSAIDRIQVIIFDKNFATFTQPAEANLAE